MAMLECKRRAVNLTTDTAGMFAGYGAIFGNVDSYGDTITRGAFAASLAEWRARGKYPAMLLQHGGAGARAEDLVPVGRWTDMREDDTGLKVEGRILGLDTDRGLTVYEAMREGVLDGLSIGFRVEKFHLGMRPGEPSRTLERVSLVEVSIVTFPANDRARVSSVKGVGPGMSARAFEAWISERLGFTAAQARTIATRGFRHLHASHHSDAEQVKQAVQLVREFFRECSTPQQRNVVH